MVSYTCVPLALRSHYLSPNTYHPCVCFLQFWCIIRLNCWVPLLLLDYKSVPAGVVNDASTFSTVYDAFVDRATSAALTIKEEMAFSRNLAAQQATISRSLRVPLPVYGPDKRLLTDLLPYVGKENFTEALGGREISSQSSKQEIMVTSFRSKRAR